jgi:hypothetical protein
VRRSRFILLRDDEKNASRRFAAQNCVISILSSIFETSETIGFSGVKTDLDYRELFVEVWFLTVICWQLLLRGDAMREMKVNAGLLGDFVAG